MMSGVNSRRFIVATHRWAKDQALGNGRRLFPGNSNCFGSLFSAGQPDERHQFARRLSSRTKGSAGSSSWVDQDDADSDFGDGFEEKPEFTANEMEFFDDIQDEMIQQKEAEHQAEKEERERQQQAQQVRDELDAKKGRLWSDPWEITDDDWSNRRTFEDLPDWSPDMCSRISMERVQVHPDGILTLEVLANLSLPPPPPPHPGHGDPTPYASRRTGYLSQRIKDLVVELAEPRIAAILKLSDWSEKQDRVDELYESIEFQLRDSETVLGKHPMFGEWVESALEQYLKSIEQRERKTTVAKLMESAKRVAETKLSAMLENPNTPEMEKREALAAEVRKANGDLALLPQFNSLVKKALKQNAKNATLQGEAAAALETSKSEDAPSDSTATPVFMDLYASSDGPSVVVPSILNPLAPHAKDGPGRMVEEWELAAHKETKRIMLRSCIREMARVLHNEVSSRLVVTGRRGVGKSAALSAIVASARKSGHIVLFLPDGDRMKRNFHYIQPNARREGIFDLPVLSMEVCGQFLQSHESDLAGMSINSEGMEKFFTEAQIKKLPIESTENVSLVDLLRVGSENTDLAAMCYSVVVHSLMNQTEKPFLMVLDEFNSYFDYNQYFHMEYDMTVRKPIPPEQVSLYQPALNALGLSVSDEVIVKPTLSVKRGGVLVGMTESKAVACSATDALVASARRETTDPDSEAKMHIIDVPRYSILESQHIVSNMEAIGIGRLRFDRGDTVMNDNEVAYLRMVSGGAGQHLLDACIL